MISASNDYIVAIAKDGRLFRARLKNANNILDGEIKNITIHKGACGKEKFTLGSLYAPYIECVIDNCGTSLQDKELLLQVGIMTNGDLDNPEFDYIDIGYFTVSKPATTSRRCTFTAYGRLSSRCGGLYESALTFPATLQSIVDEIAANIGLTITAKNGAALSGIIPKKPVGLKYYEALQVIAGLVGGYVTEDNAGGIVIALYTATVTKSVNADYVSMDPSFYDKVYQLDGITCVVQGETTDEDGNVTEEVSYTWGTGRLLYQSEYMTHELFERMRIAIGGYTYHPGTIQMAKGDPRLEPWDVIRYTDGNGNIFDVPCMDLSISYDGGISCNVSAPGESDTENSTNFSGPLTAMVEKTIYDLVVAKKVIASKVGADELEAAKAILQNAVIGTGSAASFNVANLYFEEAIGETFTADEVDALRIAFTTATGSSLSLNNLEAATATFQNALTGTLTADQIKAASGYFQTAIIRQLYVDYLSAGYAKINFANVDTATITKEWVQDLFVQGGFIADQGTFFELVGVKISGDLITANTVKADALLLRGENGLYYKLNVDALGETTAESDTKYQDGIDGSVIIAHSITADEITTQNIQGTGGWINLAAGTFAYVNAVSGHGIVWDGTELTISTDRLTIGEVDLSEALQNAVNAVNDMQAAQDNANAVARWLFSNAENEADANLYGGYSAAVTNTISEVVTDTVIVLTNEFIDQIAAYTAVSSPANDDIGNYFEYDSADERYKRTEDTTVDSGKTYYSRTVSLDAYTFTYDGSVWLLDSAETELSSYGVHLITEEIPENSVITVTAVEVTGTQELANAEYGFIYDQINANRSDFDSHVTEITKTADELGDQITAQSEEIKKYADAKVETVNDLISTLGTRVDDLDETQMNILLDILTLQSRTKKMTYDDEDGLVLYGKNATYSEGFKLQLTDEVINFIKDRNILAYMSGMKLYITNAEVLQNLQFGDFAFRKRSNGHMSLKYIGTGE